MQQFIKSHIDILDKEHTITKTLYESTTKIDKSFNTDHLSKEKYISDIIEEYKNEVEDFKEELKAQDMDESNIDEDSNLKSMNNYQSSKRNKSKAMLSRYKDFTSK